MELLAREALSNAGWAGALALVAAVVGRIFRRRPALVHTLWLLVLIKLATPSMVHRSIDFEPNTVEVSRPARSASGPISPKIDRTDGPANQVSASPESIARVVRPIPTPSTGWSWWELAAMAWVAGAAAYWGAVLRQVVRSRALFLAARPAPEALRKRAELLARRVGLRAAPTIGLVEARIPPLLLAVAGPPRLLLPEALWSGLDERQQDSVLVHELAHLRRRDHWVRWLETAVLGLCWWNPVAWWARREVEAAEEECCDAWVRWALPGSAGPYAQALVETAVFLSGPRPRRSPGTTGVRPLLPLRRRLMMILDDSATGWTNRPGTRGALLLGILALPFLPAPAPATAPGPLPRTQGAQAAPAQDPKGSATPKTSDRRLTEPVRDAAPGGPPYLRVAHPVVREVKDFEDLTGRIEAASTVEVRSPVGGVLDKVSHRDGGLVEKGEILFEVDPRVAQAEFDRADAEASRSEARVAQLAIEMKNVTRLRERAGVSQNEVELTQAKLAEAEASFRGVKAARELARLKLDSTRIRSPLSGKLARPRLSEGSLVTAESTVLGSIESRESPVVAFRIDERTALKLGRARRRDPAGVAPGVGLKVDVGLADESDFPHPGRVESIASNFDQVSGTILCRAVVPDPDGLLLPGMFARVRLNIGTAIKVMLIPEGSIAGEVYVNVVNEQNVVEQRQLRTGRSIDDLIEIKEGLKADDWFFYVFSPRLAVGDKVEPIRIETPGSFPRDP